MSESVVMPARVTTVQVSGFYPTTESKTEQVIQNIPVPHQDGVPNGNILAAAMNISRQIGGILLDTEDGGMNFYPFSKFVGPIHFVIKNVVLAGADALPKLILQN